MGLSVTSFKFLQCLQISKRIPALRIYLEVRRYLSALKSLFASSSRSLVAFERFIRLRRSGGNHSILSIISIPSEKENEAKEVRSYHPSSSSRSRMIYCAQLQTVQ